MYSATSTIWVLLGAVLVFFMQAGFAMVETGFTRAKNSGNIIMKNLMDFAIGSTIFWFIGFGIIFAGSSSLIGGIDLLTQGSYTDILPLGVPKEAFFIFQCVFCATAATIVSGAMAERTKFISYCIYSAIISAIIYPVSAHWIWGGGWLAQLGFHDFAGSTAVHMVGGVAALVGAKILGPRIGKYTKDGESRAIPGHNIPLGALGVFILWFCWFGFNGCSTVCAEGDEIIVSMGHIFSTTNLAAAVATVTVMIITWVKYKKPDVSMTLNGSLAGLVAITAGCDMVSNVGAFFIGLISGFLVVYGIEFIDKKLKIDDPVGAIGVHCICGLSGTLLTGLFSTTDGVFYGYGFSFFGVQLLGVVAVFAWVAITMCTVFIILKNTIGLRVSESEEISGLDLPEHGLVSAYSDFSMLPVSLIEDSKDIYMPSISIPTLSPEVQKEKVEKELTSSHKISHITIIANQSKFEELKAAMNKICISGMTVTQVLGCGVQNGSTEYYRGSKMEIHLLPKVKVDIVVSKVPVEKVVETAKKVLYTGGIGDGKIFVYDVEHVVRVRTGEEDYDALQYPDEKCEM
ncbi:Ammonia transporter [uncultured Clostridium sp.]|nr:Ammonia transporter [uncultured Clostridium sp.]